jgi:hypothetical protein
VVGAGASGQRSRSTLGERLLEARRSTYPLARDPFARASDGEVGAAAPDEHEPPRVEFAIANRQSRRSLFGAVLREFWKSEAVSGSSDPASTERSDGEASEARSVGRGTVSERAEGFLGGDPS